MTRRGRITIGLAVMAAMLSVVFVVFVRRGDGVIRPDDPCAQPPPMQTYAGVTLQRVPMDAFKEAQRASRGAIAVVQSYRSCARQAIACERICGSAQGCPGRCAKPGTSYHQLGAAIDITQASLDTPGVVTALTEAGWCQSVPKTDPGHFSFGGCH